METRGRIFDIQSFSVHDGPGCRTTVFFAGCPLRCEWCANPEGWIAKNQVLFASSVCKWENGCRACQKICAKEAIQFDEKNGPTLLREICKTCKTIECSRICPNNALKECGRDYSVAEIMAVLIRDFNNWGPDGGVTFSGGEPLSQSTFLLEILKACKQKQIHTAIESSACVPSAVFQAILPYVDFAFIDIKNMEQDKHKAGTGVENTQILKNIEALAKSAWRGRLIIRQPLIAGYNDSEENARTVIAFMQANALSEINLLKFHRLGATKWNQLGKLYKYERQGDVSLEQMEALQKLYLEKNIACYIGDSTPF
jgi:pyruvate formate lyase activating enzyme